MNASTFRRWLSCALPGAIAVLTAVPAAGWTDKPVKFIVPAPPGGSADLASRAVAAQVAATIKQAVIVENLVAGSGAAAVQAVLGAAPDGQMLLIGFPINASPDARKELKPVAQIARSRSEPGAWIGVMAAARTPADLIARINGAIVHAIGAKGVLERIAALGYMPGLPLTPGQLEFSIRADFERHQATARTASLQPK